MHARASLECCSIRLWVGRPFCQRGLEEARHLWLLFGAQSTGTGGSRGKGRLTRRGEEGRCSGRGWGESGLCLRGCKGPGRSVGGRPVGGWVREGLGEGWGGSTHLAGDTWYGRDEGGGQRDVGVLEGGMDGAGKLLWWGGGGVVRPPAHSTSRQDHNHRFNFDFFNWPLSLHCLALCSSCSQAITKPSQQSSGKPGIRVVPCHNR